MFITRKADTPDNLSFINENGNLPSLESGSFEKYKEMTHIKIMQILYGGQLLTQEFKTGKTLQKETFG